MTPSTKPYGYGSIETTRDGRSRVRVSVGGKAKDLGTYPTRDEAAGVLAGWNALRAAGTVETGGTTLRAYGAKWLERRELKGSRNVKTDRSRWQTHVLTAPFADLPLESIGRRDVAHWLDELMGKRAADKRARRKIGWQTRKHALNLLRACLRAAVDDELLERNAAAGLVVEKPTDVDEVWTYLTPEEQNRLIGCLEIPEPERLVIAFALFSGLRQGEQWTLELRDVHIDDAAPWVYVRWGKPGKAPKNGKRRRLELNGMALGALRRWLEILPRYLRGRKKTYANAHGLAFPTARGLRRRDGKPVRHWSTYLEAAGLHDATKRHDGRAVRWHDLRHTCASSLVAGWWGRVWRLIEVRDALGHLSITTTERYAHVAPGILAEAAAATTNLPETSPTPARVEAKAPCSKGRATQDSNLRPSASEIVPSSNDLAAVDLHRAGSRELRPLAERYLRAVVGRSRFSTRYGIELAEAVLAATAQAERREAAS